eukprot:g32960.t1
MEKPAVTEDLLTLLQQSELLSADELAKVQREHGQSELEPRALAKTLVAQGYLTRFQAERLLDGRYRGFFIDRYKLLEVLGVGGMGYVYIAHDREQGRKVALKVLTDVNEVDSGMLTRLELEARAGMMLDHPNIVRTSRLEHSGAKCFVEMEYVRSINLHEMIALAGPIGWRQACDLMMQAAAGLHHAHKKGLIHRDVKPANFLIDSNGHLKVLDFGLALAKDRPDDEFSLAMIFGHECLGTADFIAPEQIANSMEADARSDIYGLGCTFYSALTGKVPFPYPTNARKLEAQKTEEPRPMTDIIAGLPDDVVAIVGKMMAKDPADRFQTAAEVGRALKPLAKRRPLQFSMNEMLTMRADHARQKRQSRVSMRSSDVTSGSAWTSSQTRLSGSLRQQGIETAVARDTLPMTVIPSEASQSMRIVPENSTAELAAVVAEQFESSDADGRFVLVPIKGGPPIPLSIPSTVIGRDELCDVTLSLPGVSGRHCELTFDGAQWSVADLGSKNGIRIDGRQVTTALLPVGRRLTIAQQHHFRIDDLSERRRSGLGRFARIAGWVALAAAAAAGVYFARLRFASVVSARGVAMAIQRMSAAVLLVSLCLLSTVSAQETSKQEAKNEPAPRFDIDRFGSLPVRFNGRVSTFETVAKMVLTQYSGRPFSTDDAGKKQPAVGWLLDVLTAADSAQSHKVVPIRQPKLLKLLSFENDPRVRRFRKTGKPAEPPRFSLAEIRPKFAEIDREYTRIRKAARPEARDDYQKAVVELRNRLQVFVSMSLLHRFHDLTNVEKFKYYYTNLSRFDRSAMFKMVPDSTINGQWQTCLRAAVMLRKSEVLKEKANPASVSLKAIFTAYRKQEADNFNRRLADYLKWTKSIDAIRSPFHYRLPKTWREVGVRLGKGDRLFASALANGETVAEFSVGEGTQPIQAFVRHFTGKTMPDAEIYNDWRVGFGLIPLTADQLARTGTPITIAGHKGYYVDLKPSAKVNTNYKRVVGAVVRHGKHMFMVTVGLPEVGTHHIKTFESFAKSIRLGNDKELSRWFPDSQPLRDLGDQTTQVALVRDGSRLWSFQLKERVWINRNPSVPKAFDELIDSIRPLAGNPTAGIQWTVPADWQRPSGDPAPIVLFPRNRQTIGMIEIYALEAGAEADTLPLVNLWRAQSQLPAWSAEQLRQGSQTTTIAGRPVTRIKFESRPAPMPAKTNKPGMPEFTYTVPKGWVDAKKGIFRLASFRVSRGNQRAEISVSRLPQNANALVSNVNRWRAQVKLGPLSEAAVGKSVEKILVAGKAAQYVDIKGNDERRILGVIAVRDDGVWFFKMTGDAQLVESQKDAFETDANLNAQRATAPVLSAESLGRRVPGGEKWLLRDVDLDVSAGDRVALVGPSGSGKSLLLRALARLDPIDEGAVCFDGEEIAAVAIPAFRSRVVYLHQRASLGEGTVEDALRRPFEWNVHAERAFDRERIVGWLDEIGRGAPFLELELKNLSVGESQITALLRAIQLDPRLLLLDEPTSGLDPESSRLLETLVAGWLEQAPDRRAFVWVTHDPAQSERVAQQIWRMQAGRLSRDVPEAAAADAPGDANEARLGLERSLLLAGVRTVVQLVLIGFVLEWVFKFDRWYVVVGLASAMTLIAGVTAAGRSKKNYAGMWINTVISVWVSAWLVTAFALFAVLRGIETWYQPQYVIPLLGMVLGNTLNGISLGLNTFTAALVNQRDEVDAMLALGASRWEAARGTVRESMRTGLIPIINSMMVVGLVSLPGMMTGQILSGTAPMDAVKYQIVIMFLIASATALGTLGVILLSYRRLFSKDHQLLFAEIRSE